MKTHARSLTAGLLGLALLMPSSAAADGLVSGHYLFSAELSPVCLDGVYPCTIGNLDGGLLRVTTDKRGRLTGVLDLRSAKAKVTGKIAATKKAIMLVLKGADERGKFKIRAELRGNRFVGMATSQKPVPFALFISSVAPLRVSYDLIVAVDATGRADGTGTATACGVQVSVRAAGRNSSALSMLRVTGAKTVWLGSGPQTANGFTASWSAKGFGATAKGSELAIEAF